MLTLLYVKYVSVMKKRELTFIIPCIVVEDKTISGCKKIELGLAFRFHNMSYHFIGLWD